MKRKAKQSTRTRQITIQSTENLPGRIVVVVGSHGNVDNATGLVERFLEGVQTHVRNQTLIQKKKNEVQRTTLRMMNAPNHETTHVNWKWGKKITAFHCAHSIQCGAHDTKKVTQSKYTQFYRTSKHNSPVSNVRCRGLGSSCQKYIQISAA